jgi:GTPase SAR1 family protein
MGDVIEQAVKRASQLLINREVNRLYTTNEDFSRADPSSKRLIVVGCTGAGKSTLLNKMGGWKFKWVPNSDDPDEDADGSMQYEEQNGLPPIFEAGHSTNSVTQFTTYANLCWRGDEQKIFIAIDTPGHDDPAASKLDEKECRDKVSEQAADLLAKTKAMNYVNAILVIHNDVYSNRVNPMTYELLQKVDEMFKDVEGNVWDHVIIGYSKCDADSRGWRNALEKKKADLNAEIKSKFPRCKNELPILALSGAEMGKAGGKSDAEFDKLWEFIDSKDPIDTAQLTKFEGLSERVEKIVQDKDMFQRLAAARKDFTELLFKFMMAAILLFLRSTLLPFLDRAGLWDELILLGLFAWVVGPTRFFDFLCVAWDDYLLPYLEKNKLIKKEELERYRLIGKAKTD